jgi:alpha-beta hydrolase superfamily lysophospholipase
MIRHHESTFTGRGGLRLYRQHWLPDDGAQAAVVLVHGIGEHSGRYTHVVNALVPRRYAVYALDHRGHGRSDGQRGYIDDWSDFREDLRALVTLVQHETASRPMFIFCHSMGGVIGLDYALRYPDGLTGVVASAPAIGAVAVHPVMWALARVFDRVWPRLSLSPQSGGMTWKVSRDPAVLEANRHDPLNHGKATPRLGVQIKKTADWIQAQAAEWRLPLLVIHGDGDNIASPDGSRRFVERAAGAGADVELKEYAGGYHELFNDIIRDQVLADVTAWLDQKMPARHRRGT